MSNTISFQQDALFVISRNITNINQEYIKFKETDIESLTINEAESLIEIIKELEHNTQLIINSINKLINLKQNIRKQKYIDEELNKKIAPLIAVYRLLLEQKYNNINNND